ncbi:hypothetical protein RI129_004668 [Pyrocoelia pectoralis]|uniref:Zinc finger MYM-type protein 1-like n=1 Tax=Pyrocoelia pectoralis TaxID=417401 RepID=A0AAN7VLY6_9COLE
MSDAYNGVQKQIKYIQSSTYLHYASHNLNLVINDAVQGSVKIHKFFAIMQNLFNFFANRIKRWGLLSRFIAESEITLKKLNPIRWPSRVNTITAVKLRFFEALLGITLKSPCKDVRIEAEIIKSKMLNFEFVFLCEFVPKRHQLCF